MGCLHDSVMRCIHVRAASQLASWQSGAFEARRERTSRHARPRHLLRTGAGPRLSTGRKPPFLMVGIEMQAPAPLGTAVVLSFAFYGEDTKLDLKISSWQQRVSDSDLSTGGFSWSQDERLPKGRSTQDERLSKGMSKDEDVGLPICNFGFIQ